MTSFRIWAKTLWHNFQTAFTCQWNSVKSCTLWEKLKSLSFPHIMWNFIATSNDIGTIVKLAFIISSGAFWGQSSLNEKLFRFSINLDLSKKHWVELSHLLPRCRGEHSERKQEIELYSFFSIWLNDFW